MYFSYKCCEMRYLEYLDPTDWYIVTRVTVMIRDNINIQTCSALSHTKFITDYEIYSYGTVTWWLGELCMIKFTSAWNASVKTLWWQFSFQIINQICSVKIRFPSDKKKHLLSNFYFRVFQHMKLRERGGC